MGGGCLAVGSVEVTGWWFWVSRGDKKREEEEGKEDKQKQEEKKTDQRKTEVHHCLFIKGC